MAARWSESTCPVTGLSHRQARIGNWKAAGLKSEMVYRHAKKVLEKCGFATFEGTTSGTIATLMDSGVFSVSPPTRNDQINTQGTDPEQTSNTQATTNHTETPKPRTTKKQKPSSLPTLGWDHTGFTGITDTDRELWAKAYPLVDLEAAIARAALWCRGKNRPHKDIRRFLQNWLHKDQTEAHLRQGELFTDSGNQQSPATHHATASRIVSIYPRRERAHEAEQEVAQQLRADPDTDGLATTMESGTRAAAAFLQTAPGGALNQYVPSALAFFKDRRYLDDPKTLIRGGNSANGAPAAHLDLGGRHPARTVAIPQIR